MLNWEKYQGNDSVTNKGSHKEVTKTSQRANKELTPNKNDKECYKNDKENKAPSAEPEEEIMTSEELYGVDASVMYERFLKGEITFDE